MVSQFAPWLTERTLRYWESTGLLPRPVRLGRRVFYAPVALETIATLVATRPAAIARLRRRARSSVTVEQCGEVLVLKVKFKREE